MERATLLRLLQDMCSACGLLPSRYNLEGVQVNWRDRIVGGGGEALVFKGSYNGQVVVVREILKPNNESWSGQAGQTIFKVVDLFLTTSTRMS